MNPGYCLELERESKDRSGKTKIGPVLSSFRCAEVPLKRKDESNLRNVFCFLLTLSGYSLYASRAFYAKETVNKRMVGMKKVFFCIKYLIFLIIFLFCEACWASAPASPAHLTASILSKSTIALYWFDSANNEQGFKIERKRIGGNWSEIAKIGINGIQSPQNFFLDENGLNTAEYFYVYRVKSYNINGDSSFSNEATAAELPISDGFDYPAGDSEGTGPYVRYDNGELCEKGWYVPYDIMGYQGHTGEDWNGLCYGDTDKGVPVYSAAQGRVVFADYIPSAWGNVVLVAHKLSSNEVVYTQYAHLDTVDVSWGEPIGRREQIGTIGRGAPGCNRDNPDTRCDAHLHFEVRKTTVGAGYWPGSHSIIKLKYYDPSDFIDDHRPPSIKKAIRIERFLWYPFDESCSDALWWYDLSMPSQPQNSSICELIQQKIDDLSESENPSKEVSEDFWPQSWFRWVVDKYHGFPIGKNIEHYGIIQKITISSQGNNASIISGPGFLPLDATGYGYELQPIDLGADLFSKYKF